MFKKVSITIFILIFFIASVSIAKDSLYKEIGEMQLSLINNSLNQHLINGYNPSQNQECTIVIAMSEERALLKTKFLVDENPSYSYVNIDLYRGNIDEEKMTISYQIGLSNRFLIHFNENRLIERVLYFHEEELINVCIAN